MEQLPSILQRLAAINELMVYALLTLGVLTFLGLVITVIGMYRATVHHHETVQIIKEMRASAEQQHRETVETMNRLGYYLFLKLVPVQLP
jgi:hypothetical protein